MIRKLNWSGVVILFLLQVNISAQIQYDITGYLIDMPVYQNPSQKLADITGIDKNIFMNIGRLRLRPTLYINDDTWLSTEYEINSLYYSSPGQFTLLEQSKLKRQLVNLSWNITEKENIIVNHYIDRLYLKYNFKFGDIAIGRQRIAWGTGRIWNPTDLFNPINPANFAKIEKDGVDAVSFKWNAGNFTDLNLVFNPAKKLSNSNYGIRFRTNYNEYDLSIVAGKFDKSFILGGDFAGNLFDAGLRGEGIYSFKNKNSEGFLKYILGIDYQFTPEFYSAIEYHYNGKGKTNKFKYEIFDLINGNILNLSRNYLYIGASYLVSPLLTATLSNILNINDSSGYLVLDGNYSLSENIYASLGIQKTYGNIFTEYWYYPISYYLKCELYF